MQEFETASATGQVGTLPSPQVFRSATLLNQTTKPLLSGLCMAVANLFLVKIGFEMMIFKDHMFLSHLSRKPQAITIERSQICGII